MKLWSWFRNRPRQPQQLALPFWCEHYGEACGPFTHAGITGFYGYCVKCGVTYDPVCDR